MSSEDSVGQKRRKLEGKKRRLIIIILSIIIALVVLHLGFCGILIFENHSANSENFTSDDYTVQTFTYALTIFNVLTLVFCFYLCYLQHYEKLEDYFFGFVIMLGSLIVAQIIIWLLPTFFAAWDDDTSVMKKEKPLTYDGVWAYWFISLVGEHALCFLFLQHYLRLRDEKLAEELELESRKSQKKSKNTKKEKKEASKEK